MNKQKITGLIFDGLNTEFKKDNIFETSEFRRYWEKLTDAIPERLEGLDNKAVSDYGEALSEILFLERKAAFTIGFNAAIEMIMESIDFEKDEE